MTSVYLVSRSISSTLARRRTCKILAPIRNAWTSDLALGKPLGQSYVTAATCLPGKNCCRPIRTVSTSGSSGIGHDHCTPYPHALSNCYLRIDSQGCRDHVVSLGGVMPGAGPSLGKIGAGEHIGGLGPR